ncbi:MAG: hypothetical protein ACRD82_07175, partial [Blastocatellia bacterium]
SKRNAIVILTDGVDWHSDSSTFEGNILDLEESGVLVYPIRYNNRSQVEAMLRKQKTTDFDAVFGVGGIGGITPATVPVETRGQTQKPQKPEQAGQPGKDAPYKLPVPVPPIGRGRYPDKRNPDGKDIPSPDEPSRQPDMRRPPDPHDYPDKTQPASDKPAVPTASGRLPTIGTGVTLDNAYNRADQYLKALADATGGELHRTEKVTDLPDIFQRIVSDLRNQYLLGYYPTNAARDGKYRKIKVQALRKDVVIRARPGYRPKS